MTLTTHAIILAAGDGRRLAGLVPTGLKPLLIVNGEPLVKRLVGQLLAAHVHNITIVTSPTNVGPIVELVGTAVNYIVQPTAAGPGDALLRGMWVSNGADRTLVIAADNYFTDDVIPSVLGACGLDVVAVGTRLIYDADTAKRFTRVGFNNATFNTEEGPTLGWPGPWNVWCGPLCAPTAGLFDALDAARRRQDDWPIVDELLIGPHIEQIGDYRSGTTQFILVEVDAQDIGVPEAIS